MVRVGRFGVVHGVGIALVLPLIGCSDGGGGGKPKPLDPPAVIIVSSSASGEIRITWSLVSGADTYNLYWSTMAGVTATNGTPITDVTAPYDHTGLTDGTTVYYVVTAVSGKRESAESPEGSAMPLAAPTGISAAGGTSDAVVDWSPVTGATSYNIYWGISPGVTKTSGVPIAGVNPPYTVAGLMDGTTYYFVVSAANSVGGGAESTESQEACAQPIVAPTGTACTGTTGGIDVDWTPVPGAACYNIYWGTAPGVTKATGTPVSCVTPPHLVTGLTGGTTYYVVVTAVSTVCTGGESAESPEVFAAPVDPPTGVVATPAFGEVTIDWNPSAGATAYDIYWDTNPGVTKGTGTPILGVTAPYPHTGLINGTTHYYVVVASNATGGGAESVESLEVSATPDVTGLLDTSFATVGWVTHNDAAGGAGSDTGWAITLDASGRILVTGQSARAVADDDMVIWRFLTDGSLDAAFGTAGVVVDDNAAGGSAWDAGYGITLDGSGMILVSGFSHNAAGDDDMVVWRFQTDGAPDASFGPGGFTVHDSAAGGAFDDYGHCVRVDGAGRIIVAGESYGAASPDMAVWAYDSTGALDLAFDTDGFVVDHGTAGGDGTDRGYAMILDASDGPIVAGHSWNGSGNDDMVIWAYDSTGTPVAAFGAGGVVVDDGAAGGNLGDYAYGITLDGAGRILVAGESLNGTGDLDMVIWAYDAAGAPDATFGTGGVAVHDDAAGGGSDDAGYGITVDTSGRILVTGYSIGPGSVDMVIWRYTSTGTPDAAFGAGGVAVHDGAGGPDSDDYGYAITVDASGKILVTGESYAGSSSDMVVWRFQ